MSESEPTKSVTRREKWKSHIIEAQGFPGSDAEYCRINQLSAQSFYSYKKKLGFVQPRLRPREKFVKIETGSLHGSESNRPLPDARWTADFVLALLSQR